MESFSRVNKALLTGKYDGFLTLMLIKHLPVKTRNPKLQCNVINRQRHKDKRHKTIRHKTIRQKKR
jgi:hypothetical protein